MIRLFNIDANIAYTTSAKLLRHQYFKVFHSKPRTLDPLNPKDHSNSFGDDPHLLPYQRLMYPPLVAVGMFDANPVSLSF